MWCLNHWTIGKVPQLLTLTSNLIIGTLKNGITTILAAQSPTLSHSGPSSSLTHIVYIGKFYQLHLQNTA